MDFGINVFNSLGSAYIQNGEITGAEVGKAFVSATVSSLVSFGFSRTKKLNPETSTFKEAKESANEFQDILMGFKRVDAARQAIKHRKMLSLIGQAYTTPQMLLSYGMSFAQSCLSNIYS